MVKKVLIFFAYFIFFTTSLLYFAPKVSLYYFVEHKLKEFSVIISSEEPKDRGLRLLVKNADISISSIEAAKISKIKIDTFLLYNTIKAENITLLDMAKPFVPLKVQKVNVSLSILNPLNANITAIGEFGEAYGTFHILDSNLSMRVTPSELMMSKYSRTLRSLKKTEDGEYIYVKKF